MTLAQVVSWLLILADLAIATVGYGSPTSTGLQTYTTGQSIGTPKCYLAVQSRAQLVDTVYPQGIIGVGFGDGTTERSTTMRVRHNQSTTDTSRRSRNNASLLQIDVGGAIRTSAAFDAFVSDGGRFNWTVTQLLQHLGYITFFAGDDLTVKVGEALSGSTQDGTTTISGLSLGGSPDLILFFSPFEAFDDVDKADAHLGFGMAVNDRGTIKQRGFTFWSEDNVATSNPAAMRASNRVLANISGATLQSALEVTGMTTSDQFTVTLRSGTTAIRFAYMAMRFVNKPRLNVTTELSRVTTGNHTYNVGIKPQFELMLLNLVSSGSPDTVVTSGQAGGMAIAVASSGVHRCASFNDEDAQATTDTQCVMGTEPVRFYLDDGTVQWVAPFVSFQNTGPQYNFTTAGSSTRGWPFLTIGANPTRVRPSLKVTEVDQLAPVPVTPPAPDLRLTEMASLGPVPVTPPERLPLSALQASPFEPSPVTPVVPGLTVSVIDDLDPVPVTPVPGVLVTNEVEPFGPAPVSPVSLGLTVLELAGLSPVPVTPVSTALSTLTVAGLAPVPVSPVSVDLKVLQLAQLAPMPVTPVAVDLAVVRIVGLGPVPVSPVTPGLAGLRLLVFVPTIIADDGDETVVTVPLSTTQLVHLTPTFVLTGLGCYEYVTNELRVAHHHALVEDEGLVVSWDNSPISRPGVAHATVELLHQFSQHRQEGGRTSTFRKHGISRTSLWYPVGEGTGVQSAQASRVAAALRDTLHGIVQLEAPSVTQDGRDGQWWVYSVTSRWRADVDVQLGRTPGGASVMVSYDDAEDTARSRFKAQVTDNGGADTYPTRFDNAPFQEPEGSLWIDFSVQFPSESSRQVETGGDSAKLFRTDGRGVAMIFIPIGIGTGQLTRLADIIDAAFRAQTVDGVTFRKPSLVSVGRSRDNPGMWQGNVEIPFWFDLIG